jgi:hypothetical protein
MPGGGMAKETCETSAVTVHHKHYKEGWARPVVGCIFYLLLLSAQRQSRTQLANPPRRLLRVLLLVTGSRVRWWL